MAACCRQPSADYTTLSPIIPPQNLKIQQSPFLSEQRPPVELSLSPEPCDSSYSTLPSPIEANPIRYDPYVFPKEDLNQDFKENQIFDFGSCDDWASWDEAVDSILSPSTTDFFPEIKMETSTPTMGGLELHSSTNQYHNPPDELSAVFGDDRIEAPLFQSPPPREILYSTPLSWSPPSGPVRSNSSHQEPHPFLAPLSPTQQARLIAQAMPARSSTCAPSPSTASSPDTENETSTHGLKRKSTSYGSDEEDEGTSARQTSYRHPPVKKTAHNMIEKRYRTNLNDKIGALRDSVPSLRVVTRRNSRGVEIEEDLDGLTPAHKLNKATILSKATEYIAHIERRNRVLLKETTALRSRVEAFEKLMMANEPSLRDRHRLQQLQQRRSAYAFPFTARQADAKMFRVD